MIEGRATRQAPRATAAGLGRYWSREQLYNDHTPFLAIFGNVSAVRFQSTEQVMQLVFNS